MPANRPTSAPVAARSPAPRALLVVVSWLCVSATGCFTNSVLTLARTNPKGTVTGYFGPSGVVLTAPGSGGGTAGLAQIEGGFHYSVHDRVEVGLKAYIPGLAFDTKVGFIRSPTGESGFNLSIDPEIGIMGFGVGSSSNSGSGGRTSSGAGAGALTFSVPLLLGIDLAGHELVIAPRVTDWLAIIGSGGVSGGANLVYVGGGIGMAFRITPRFRLMPNVSVMVPVVGTAFTNGTTGTATWDSGALVAQFGLGFLFGGVDERARAPMVMPAPVGAPLPPP